MNYGIVAGQPGQWAINNSLKNIVLPYVRNILDPNNIQGHYNSYFRQRGRNYVAVNENGRPVGFAILGPNRASGTTRLLIIGTKPGHGIGGLLLSQIENNARARGVRKLRIMDPVNNARSFYQHLGYKAGVRVRGNNTMYKKLSRRRGSSRRSPARRASSVGSSARRSSQRQTPRR